MQITARSMALTIVLLFVGSLMAGFTTDYNGIEQENLEEEIVVQYPLKQRARTRCLRTVHLLGQLWALLKTGRWLRCAPLH